MRYAFNSKELLITIIVVIVTVLLAQHFEFAEWLFEWSRQHKEWQIDELVTVFFVLTFAFGIFFCRRSYELAREITRRQDLEELLRKQALYDTLTALPNRRLFLDRLTSALERANRTNELVAVVFLDLDDFKDINDNLGHQAGDGALVEVARRLAQCIRTCDTVARLSGDEFTILLVDIADTEDVVRVVQRILEALGTPIMLNEHTIQITTSIGIALNLDAETHAKKLLHNADIAMYTAKQNGKSHFAMFDQKTSMSPEA